MILKGNYKENYYCVDEDTMVIWSFDGSENPDYNELVKRHKIKKLVVNTGEGSIIPKAIFQDCKGIKTVKIMDGVTSIGDYAFYNCSGLTRVTIGNGVTSIGVGAFGDCSSLTSIEIPSSVTSIGEGAFYNCSGLTSIKIPDSVMSIGFAAFSGCTRLMSITIPDSVTSIGNWAFSFCSGMTSVTIGNGVTKIGERAFDFCSKLTRVDYTGTIADWCGITFSGLSSNPLLYAHNLYINGELVTSGSLVIPNDVTSIGDYAFLGCDNLESLSIPAHTVIDKVWACDAQCKLIRRPEKEVEMADYLRFYQLEEGVFYYVLEHNDEPENRFVWYKRDGRLKNPRCCSDTLNTSEQYHYCPITLDEVDEFDEWMEENGDCIGRITWTAYKMKLREAKMAKKNDAEKKEEVDLYDPKFVHFDWDEELRGKKAFHCDEINGLKHLVRTFDRDAYHEIKKSSNPSYPFQIDTHVWKFAYYDPQYEVKWAYFKEGKKIQMRREGTEWFDVIKHYDEPSFFDSDGLEFRIKPEGESKAGVEVNVNVNINNTSSDGKIKITINGKECIFENAEQARMVLKEN